MWTLDVVTAVLLFAVLGWQWLLLPGLVMEAIPGVAVIPVLAAGRRRDCRLGDGSAEIETVNLMFCFVGTTLSERNMQCEKEPGYC